MPEQFSEKIEVLDSASNVTITLDGNAGDISAGGNAQDGDLIIRNAAGDETLRIAGDEGDIIIKQRIDGTLREVMRFDGSHAVLYLGGEGNNGDFIMRDEAGNETFYVAGNEGDIHIKRRIDGTLRRVMWFDASRAALRVGANGNAGNLYIKNAAGDDTLRIHGDEGDIIIRRRIDGALRQVMKFDASGAALRIGTNGNAGGIFVRDALGKNVFGFAGSSAMLYIGGERNAGDIIVRDGAGTDVFRFFGDAASLYIGGEGNEGDIVVRDGAGNGRIRLDGGTGDIRLQGADCAEEFDVAGLETNDPGTVLVIDEGGKLRPCHEPYDKKVAGVVSGGNGSSPGIILNANPVGKGRSVVALSGKVHCKVDAQYSPIDLGDLLTSSPTPGHAMKAEDPLRAFGAVIGKALSGLEEGRGLIPILVSLQ